MQAARVLAGDYRLFRALQQTLRREVYRRDYPEFLAQMLAERDERYRRHGGSVYLQEPNVKESAGGLRDVHTALWLASARFGTRTLRELEDKGLLTAKERTATDAALTFLWRVRNELHFLAGTKQDVLERRAPGPGGQEPRLRGRRGAARASRAFMRDYYRHARTIHRISARLIARCQEGLARHGTVGRRGRRAALADGLVVYDGRLHLAEPGALQADPARILRVFWHAQQLGCGARRGARAGARGGRADARRGGLARVARAEGRVPVDPPLVGARGDDAPADARHRRPRRLPARSSARSTAWSSTTTTTASPWTSTRSSPWRCWRGSGPGQGPEIDELAQIFAEVERPGAPHARHPPARHRQGARARPRGEGRAAHQGRDAPAEPGRRRRGGGRVPGRAPPPPLAHRPSAGTSTTRRRWSGWRRSRAFPRGSRCSTSSRARTSGRSAPGVWNAWRGALLRELYVRTRTRLAGRFPKAAAPRGRGPADRAGPGGPGLRGRPRRGTSRRCRTATSGRRRPSAWPPTSG